MKSPNIQKHKKDRSLNNEAKNNILPSTNVWKHISDSFDFTSSADGSYLLSALVHDVEDFQDLEIHGDIVAPNMLLAHLLQTLQSSPTARLLLKEAMHDGWQLGLDDLPGYDFHLDIPEGKIILNSQGLGASVLFQSGHFRNALLMSLTRALRDVWQEKRLAGFDQLYRPETILTLERVRAADCDVLAIMVGWELRSEGKGDLWRYLIGSSEGDMALVYAAYLEKDPSSGFTKKALWQCFKEWFAEPARVDSCDHETLEYMDSVIFDNPHINPFGTKFLTTVGVEMLSCLPDKTAYLQGFGEDILRDPIFSGMNDPVNQSHFMQILHDTKVIYAGGVPFSNLDLASKIFPDMFIHDVSSEKIH